MATPTWTSRCVSTPKITSSLGLVLWASIIITFAQLLSMWRSLSTRGAGEHGRYCDGSRHRRAPMRSRRCSGPGRPLGDTKVSGRRVTCKAPLAHLEGGSGRSKTSPTAILQCTHSLEGEFCEVRYEISKDHSFGGCP